MSFWEQAFYMHQGEIKGFTVTVTDPTNNNAAVPLSGKYLLYRVAKSAVAPANLIEKRLDATHTDITIANNIATIGFLAADTATVASGILYHELRVIDTVSGNSIVVMSGPFRLYDSQTVS